MTEKNNKSKPASKKRLFGAPIEANGGNEAVFVLSPKKIRLGLTSAVTFLLAIAIAMGVMLGTSACGSVSGDGFVLPNVTVSNDKPTSASASLLSPVDPDDPALKDSFTYEYGTNTIVGFSAEVLGKVDPVKPESDKDNEGLAQYPKYGSTLKDVIGVTDDKVAARNALIKESVYLTSSNTSHNSGNSAHPYNMMDAEGKLWYVNNGVKTESVDDNGEQRTLYKHSTAEGMYLGNVDDSEPRLKKRVTMRPRGYNGYGVTGLYAPAGEVIKIEINNTDMEATGGLSVHIGQALYNGQANNIWQAKNQMQRLPVILNTMVVNKDTATYDEATDTWTAYVGSFVGGPLYIRNTGAKFTATVSGGVAYSHFILGYTTKEEFDKNAKSSAPYFDLEVWDKGVLHSGPKTYSSGFSYEDLYKAAVLWEKVASVTTTGSNQGIVFIYDPFVAAGAAVAFPGRRSVNCPTGWMSGSLNYNGLVSSGSWGNFHEYHHNFQGYGVGNGGEVTNNGMTLVSYALFTKISSNRGISNFGAQGMSGWNRYASATWALEQTLKIAREDENPENGKQGLALYATLLHNLGADNYIQAKVTQSGGQNYGAYFKSWQNVTHNNMSYFFKDVLQGVSESEASELGNSEYPMFVPVSCVYQTGRSYMYDGEKKYIQTMQPYVIPYGETFNIDLSPYSAPGGQYAGGSIVTPEGFEYSIKSVTSPANGSIEVVDGYNLKFTPNDKLRSGQILVTLEIKKKDNAFKVDDVDLILEFEQSHNANKMTLERTTYTYSADTMYTDAQTAYENGYKGYTDKADAKHTNPTQNCNTDIWFYPNNEATREKYPDAPESYFVHDNTIEELNGKLYVQDEGRYRIYLRGRLNCALYVSLDGTFKDKDKDGNPFKVATIKDTTAPSDSALFRPNDENTYIDLDLKAESWLYIKEVLIVQSSPSISYIGVGLKQWSEPMFTMVEKYFDKDGNPITDPESNLIDTSKTVTEYYDYQGKQVTAEQAAKADPIPPTFTNNSQPYVNAYRSSFEFITGGFESDYFYQRKYNYNYVGEIQKLTEDGKQTLVAAKSNFTPWLNKGETVETSAFNIKNLFDGDPGTCIHTGNDFYVGAENPAIFTVDAGKQITANSIVLYPAHVNDNYRKAFPKDFTLEVSPDGNEFVEIGKWTGKTVNANTSYVELTFNDGAAYTFRYYKLTVTDTNINTKRVVLADVSFNYTLRLTGNGSNAVAPNNSSLIYKGKWEIAQVQSTFGNAYLGDNGSAVKFEMIGTRLAILTSNAYGKNFEVYIDGKICNSIDVKEVSGEYGISYISQKLTSGKHSVEIRCKGKVGIDSFAIYDEA